MRLLAALIILPSPLAFADAPVPEALDRAALLAAVTPVKAEAEACATKHPARGFVKVTTTILPSGAIARVEIKVTPDRQLGECVAAAFRKMKFPRTRTGGAFTFPFDFSAQP